MVIRNPFRRRYLVQKFIPSRPNQKTFPGWGTPVIEQPPAPAFRRYYRLETAKQVVVRLNSGMQAIQAPERFRVTRLP